MEIRRAGTVAEVAAAEYLFDNPMRTEWAERFLAAPGHHLFLAYENADGESGEGGKGGGGGTGVEVPVGFVSGVETVHPDKGTEMLLYELEVAEPYRRRGIGRALVRRLAALGRELGCYGMWVLVDAGNDVALAAYRSAGGKDDGTCSVVTWDFST
ncbi:GNAT family N-acetyltransferase [Streptomyces carpinensis]|uniref:GNAT family N-acetyltransferase n=2 Tax=Streptomyces carpinensis TaxID=66369 RepID=A0ABV1WFW4_9ACTN